MTIPCSEGAVRVRVAAETAPLSWACDRNLCVVGGPAGRGCGGLCENCAFARYGHAFVRQGRRS